ncbi:hypothetical protein CSV76_16520 [Sporosarcina sp. P17b]|nr:hypothetical protein CSV76_16520 [Sporosarcina sp. P17b]
MQDTELISLEMSQDGASLFCVGLESNAKVLEWGSIEVSEFVSGSGWKLQLGDAFPWALGEPTRSQAPFWLSLLSG